MKNYLLAIGVNEYESNRFKTLSNAESDTQKLIKILEERYGFEELRYLLGEEASRKNIVNSFIELKHLDEESNLILFFAGHGEMDPDTERGYLVPYDGTERAEWISYTTLLHDYLTLIKSKHVLLILDCCFSGSFITRGGGSLRGRNDSYDKRYLQSSRYLLASGGKEPVSDGREESPFFQRLKMYLEENTKAKFAVSELGAELKKKVGEDVLQQPICEPIQELKNHVAGGEFVFFLKNEFVEDKDGATEDDFEYDLQINDDFDLYLNDLGIKITHSKVPEVNLVDLFVPPDFSLDRSKDGKGKLKTYVFDKIITKDKNIYLGEDKSGKTTLAKRLFCSKYIESFIPVIVRGKNVRKPDKKTIISLVEKGLLEQYNLSKDKAKKLAKDAQKIVVIIDDYDGINLKENKFRLLFFKNLSSTYKHVHVFSSPAIRLDALDDSSICSEAYSEYSMYTILPLGHLKREEIVKKWYFLGEKEGIESADEVFWSKVDLAKSQIKNALGRNYVPSYPLFIITLLQSLEGNVQKPEYTLHGFYYELLINNALSNVLKETNDISFYHNYMTNLAFFLYENGDTSIEFQEFKEFHNLYSEKFSIPSTYEPKSTLGYLERAKLLVVKGSVIDVKYKYIFYFFLAKFFADNLNSSEPFDTDKENALCQYNGKTYGEMVRGNISKMCKKLHVEKYSSIVMFLTHLSKDKFIIKQVLKITNELFESVSEANLDKDVAPINKLIEHVPKKIIERKSQDTIRKERNQEKDSIDMLEKEFNDEAEFIEPIGIGEDLYEDDFGDLDMFSEYNFAFKAIEILGQIAKKHWGALTGGEKEEIIKCACDLTLRTNTYFFDKILENKIALIREIESILKKDLVLKKGLPQEIEEATRQYIFDLCSMITYGIITKLGASIGYKKLQNSMDALVNKNPNNANKIIQIAFSTSYGVLPSSVMDQIAKEFENNYLPFSVLRRIVVNYIYMFPVSSNKRQKIFHAFHIEEKAQIVIGKNSKIKIKN